MGNKPQRKQHDECPAADARTEEQQDTGKNSDDSGYERDSRAKACALFCFYKKTMFTFPIFTLSLR